MTDASHVSQTVNMSYAEAMLVHSDNDRKLQQALHAEKQAMQAEQALREAQVVGALRQELSTATDLLRRVVVNTASEFTPTFGLFGSNPLVGYVRPGQKNEMWKKQQKKIHVWPLNCRHQHFVCNGQPKVDGRLLRFSNAGKRRELASHNRASRH